MNVEIIGDREFITAVQEQGSVWVLMAVPGVRTDEQFPGCCLVGFVEPPDR